MNTADTPAPAPARTRKKALIWLAVVVIVCGVAFLLYWLLYGRTHLSTDDAYVGGDLVQITPLTGGTVVAINADNTDLVRAGQPVVRLDPTDATLALERAATQLAQAVRSTRGQTFSADAAAAEVALRAAQLKEAQGNLARRQKLAGTEAVTAEELANTRDAVASAEAALNAARQQQAAGDVEGTALLPHLSEVDLDALAVPGIDPGQEGLQGGLLALRQIAQDAVGLVGPPHLVARNVTLPAAQVGHPLGFDEMAPLPGQHGFEPIPAQLVEGDGAAAQQHQQGQQHALAQPAGEQDNGWQPALDGHPIPTPPLSKSVPNAGREPDFLERRLEEINQSQRGIGGEQVIEFHRLFSTQVVVVAQ